jgi:hypothetical protein
VKIAIKSGRFAPNDPKDPDFFLLIKYFLFFLGTQLPEACNFGILEFCLGSRLPGIKF